jgi:site-specific DNA-methyltransferase (adenine-specific)
VPSPDNPGYPYYDDGQVTIWHGDARNLLPTLSADVILTDFPYATGVEYEQYADTAANLDVLIGDVLPMMRAAAPVVALTCGIANVWRYPSATWILCWHATNASPTTGRWGFNGWQPILVYGGDPYLKRGRGRRLDVVDFGPSGKDLVAARDSGHPCAKPFGAWKAVLGRLSPDPSDVVLDPFMGSGTTIAAAKAMGRKAIGIELTERYCEIAARRVAQLAFDFEGVA